MKEAGFLRKPTAGQGLRVRENYKGNACFLTFPVFDGLKGFSHGFSTRLGGVSTGEYSSMSLSFKRGDDREKVFENYKRLSEAAGFSLETAVCTDQTHTTNVRIVTAEDRGSGILKEKTYSDIDGMVTDEPDVTLVASFADCIPLFFIDPVKRAVGLSHSGWKGTAGKIGLRTVETMKSAFGSDPEDIFAAIGPGICVDCYEVSEDVAEKFEEAFSSDIAKKLLIKKNSEGSANGLTPLEGGQKYLLDLWEANRQVLLEAGLKPSNIEVTDICTCCNPTLLFSHRASGGKHGNMAGFIRIEP